MRFSDCSWDAQAPDLSNIKPDDIINGAKNLRPPQPGQEIKLPTGGTIQIPTELKSKDGVFSEVSRLLLQAVQSCTASRSFFIQ